MKFHHLTPHLGLTGGFTANQIPQGEVSEQAQARRCLNSACVCIYERWGALCMSFLISFFTDAVKA